uniref:Endoribonuclease n=1 Tax=Syphacia muris TaxID=451379 RepID=A0A0N5AEY2_9BILA
MYRKIFVFLLVSQKFLIHLKGNPVTSNVREQLQELINRMWRLDTDRPTDYRLDWGRQCDGYRNIAANKSTNSESTVSDSFRLFTYVNEGIFRKGQYSTLISLYSSSLFRPFNNRIDMNAFEQNEYLMRDVFDAFTNTTVFMEALRYLQEKVTSLLKVNFQAGTTATSGYLISGLLHTIEGELICNCVDSNPTIVHSAFLVYLGFQHVYLGEWKGMTVGGLHSWVRYYHLEQSGAINYYCYINHAEDISGTVSFSWEGRKKKVGGFNIATSPAFDFAVFTICALLHPGQKSCSYKLNGYSIAITTYRMQCSTGTCLASAYPTYIPETMLLKQIMDNTSVPLNNQYFFH